MPDKNHSGGHFEMDMMMSQKEAKRGQVMELLLAGKIDQKEAGKMPEEAIAKRCTTDIKGHKPAAGHPWRKMHIGKSATDSKTVIQ